MRLSALSVNQTTPRVYNYNARPHSLLSPHVRMGITTDDKRQINWLLGACLLAAGLLGSCWLANQGPSGASQAQKERDRYNKVCPQGPNTPASNGGRNYYCEDNEP